MSSVTFSRSKTNPDAWNLRGPATKLVTGAVVSVEKKGGATVRKVVGRVLETFPGGDALAEIHPTMTVAEATKRAKKAAKAAARPVVTDEQKAILRSIAAQEGEDAAAKHYRGWFGGTVKAAAAATLDILAEEKGGATRRSGGDLW